MYIHAHTHRYRWEGGKLKGEVETIWEVRLDMCSYYVKDNGGNLSPLGLGEADP